MKHAWKWLIVGRLVVSPAAAVSKSVETTSGIIYIQNKQYEEAREDSPEGDRQGSQGRRRAVL